jgi:dipeptidyl aminopeptidase/acylaminoacyl peptidase
MPSPIASCLLLGAVLLPASLAAEPSSVPPPVLPVETIFTPASISRLALSPNGKYLACLVTYEKHANVAVVDLEKLQKHLLTALKDKDVTSILWANDDRIIFTADPGGYENPYVYAVNRDGSDAVTLREGGETVGANARFRGFLDRLDRDRKHILVEADVGQLGYPDVCLMDLVTGNLNVKVPNPGHVGRWLTDRQQNVRIGFSKEETHEKVLYRDVGNYGDWTVLEEYEEETPHWEPVAFDGDGRTLYVASDVGRHTAAIYRYDTVTRQMGAQVAADDTYDLVDPMGNSMVLYDKSREKVTGFYYQADRPKVIWIDDDAARFQEKMDASLPGYVNRQESISPDGTRRLILSFNDRDPGVYYLFDAKTKRIEELAVLKPAIVPGQMAPMRPVTFRARDGLELHGYLTLPIGRPPRNLPLIIHPHGGPYGPRDDWGFNPEVQFYANRGFAVLQINYRGSGGYGLEFMQAGYKKWGLEMQNDLSDGVKWAVEQGVADAARVVISGASYGGYAAMAGLTLTPELYCAGINYVGVTDLVLRAERFTNRSRDGKRWHDVHVGDLNRERKRLAETSPVNLADRICVPVLMGYGKNDRRVEIEHCYAMERALKSAGKPYEVVIEGEEGHGFRTATTSVSFFQRVDQFLANNVLAPGKVKIGPTKVTEMPAETKK